MTKPMCPVHIFGICKCCQVAAMVQGRGTKVQEHDKRSSTPAPLRDMKRVWMESLSQGMHEMRV